MEFLTWQYLIFELPMVSAVLYVLFLALGLVESSASGDVDMDVDADLDADLDADFDADLDVDVDADLDADTDFDVAQDVTHSGGGLVPVGNSGVLHSALSYIGIGKVPSVLMLSFCLIWGFSGMVVWRCSPLCRVPQGCCPRWAAGTAAPF